MRMIANTIKRDSTMNGGTNKQARTPALEITEALILLIFIVVTVSEEKTKKPNMINCLIPFDITALNPVYSC